MKTKIINVLKKMGAGLEAANTNGAMSSTTKKSAILLKQKKEAPKKTAA